MLFSAVIIPLNAKNERILKTVPFDYIVYVGMLGSEDRRAGAVGPEIYSRDTYFAVYCLEETFDVDLSFKATLHIKKYDFSSHELLDEYDKEMIFTYDTRRTVNSSNGYIYFNNYEGTNFNHTNKYYYSTELRSNMFAEKNGKCYEINQDLSSTSEELGLKARAYQDNVNHAKKLKWFIL